MANFTAAIANRGYFITPHFIKSTNDNKNIKVFKKNYTSIDSIHFKPVIEGMEKVVKNGTARIAKINGINICGKTGTVENFIKLNGKKTQLTDHSMFIAFAPKDKAFRTCVPLLMPPSQITVTFFGSFSLISLKTSIAVTSVSKILPP